MASLCSAEQPTSPPTAAAADIKGSSCSDNNWSYAATSAADPPVASVTGEPLAALGVAAVIGAD